MTEKTIALAFMDIENFTAMCETAPPEEIVQVTRKLFDQCCETMGPASRQCNGTATVSMPMPDRQTQCLPSKRVHSNDLKALEALESQGNGWGSGLPPILNSQGAIDKFIGDCIMAGQQILTLVCVKRHCAPPPVQEA